MINEPSYGFLNTDRIELAKALEAVRRRICAYNMGLDPSRDVRCDCKYGLSIDKIIAGEYQSSEQTGCPELRSVIYLLLHGEEDWLP